MRALETSFFVLTQVAFWVGQEAENEFKVTCDPLKHRFFDFTQIAFSVGQEEVNESPVIGDYFKTSLSRHHQSRILVLSIRRN